MNHNPKSLSPGKAVTIGSLVVNVPVLFLLFGPGIIASKQGLDPWLVWLLPVSFLAAWAWWSFTLPRWRLWAYERSSSTSAVDREAMAAGLAWRRGSVFERTEFKTEAMRRRQREIERHFP